MFEKNDYREIVQDVTRSVLENVQEQLKQLYPSILNGIIQQVDQKYRAEINGLNSQIQDLTRRIASLEKRPAAPAPVSRPASTPQPSYSGGSGARIDMNKVKYMIYKKFNGWVYYLNQDMMDYLYKVREDGTCNTQMTNYSVLQIHGINDGKLEIYSSGKGIHKINL